MANLIRWEPMREVMTLRDALDRLFDDSFTRPLNGSNWSMPAIDLYQTDDDVVVKATVPGIKPDDVHISVTGNMLTLKGEFKQDNETKEATYHMQEQSYGIFERTVTLPTEVQTDKSKAEFEDGILTITLPKAEEVKPRTITVNAK